MCVMYQFKEKSDEELVEMGIAPVTRDFWIEGAPPKPSKPKQAVDAETEKPLSKRQWKKVCGVFILLVLPSVSVSC